MIPFFFLQSVHILFLICQFVVTLAHWTLSKTLIAVFFLYNYYVITGSGSVVTRAFCPLLVLFSYSTY